MQLVLVAVLLLLAVGEPFELAITRFIYKVI